MPLKQSFSWWCFVGRGVPDDALLAGAKQMGYAAVELIGVELFDKARDHGLVIASHAGHQSISSGLNDLREHDRIEREIKDNLELAVRYEIPNLIVFSGERMDGHDDEEGIHNSAIGLRRVGPMAEQAGVNLVIELLNSRVDHAGYQCDRTPWGVEVCKRVESERVKLLYDIYHMQIMEGDLIRTIREFSPYFAHYHTAGNPGRRDMDDTQEICYPPIARAIRETGYEGYIGHEFIPKGEPLAALQAAHTLFATA